MSGPDLSRRGMLGALSVAALAAPAAATMTAGSSDAAWRQAVVRYMAVRNRWLSTLEAADTLDETPEAERAQKIEWDASEAETLALDALVAVPAPSLAALIEKIEITRLDVLDRSDLGDFILADLRRLGSN